MSKYELSLSPSYVVGWTIVDAVRELFQNALDQEIVCPSNKMFFDYEEDTQTLRVGNKESILEAKTLLLGVSSKREDPNTIGQFGEGYKIATLVLLRFKKKITFYNYGKREVWYPKIVKSRRYGGEEILTFTTDKNFPWIRVPNDNLTIEIVGITVEEYAEIVEKNLHCHDDIGEVIETDRGRILLDSRYKGKVFVNGLFVCSHKEYEQGYDFKPQYIKLDRDRKLVSDLDLQWLSSTMWNMSGSEKVIELAKDGAADVRYLEGTSHYRRSNTGLYNDAYAEFKREYGPSAVPVTSQTDLEAAKRRYVDAKPVFVSESYKHLVVKSEHFHDEVQEVEVISAKERLRKWYEETVETLIDGEEREAFEAIFEDL